MHTKNRYCLSGALAAIALLIAGCGDAIGTACSITGSGFTASHDCRVKCLYYSDVRCPDGSVLKPQICSGASDCDPGSCPDGQVCYSYEDPFEQQSYCVPDTLCGAHSAEALATWEAESRRLADSRRAAMQERTERRSVQGKPTEAATPGERAISSP